MKITRQHDFVNATGISAGCGECGDIAERHQDWPLYYQDHAARWHKADTPEEAHYQQHKLHTVRVGHDGTNRCSCGASWPNMVGRTHLDAALNGGG